MNILVTGGLGFIGSFVVEKLLERGYAVTIIDNLAPQVHRSSHQPLTPANVKLLIGDIRDRGMMEQALTGVDVVIHCAAAVGVAQSLYQPYHYIDVNVAGTALLLELLLQRKQKLHKLILLSSMTEYGEGLYLRPSDDSLIRIEIRDSHHIQKHGWEPVCPYTGELITPVPIPEDAELLGKNIYALSKRYQEELTLTLAQLYAIPAVCLRLFNVYGPRQSLSNPYTGVLAIFLSRLLAGQPPIIFEDGNQTRDFVSVHDVCRAILLALDNPKADGQVFNIGSGEPRRIIECATTLTHLLGKDAIEPLANGEFRKGDIRHCTADIRKAQRVLNYQPQITWYDGLQELVQWAKTASSADYFAQADAELRQHGLIQKF